MTDAVLVPFVAVTVCGPATVAVHAAPRRLPSGAMENAVDDVTFPSGLLNWSKPEAANGSASAGSNRGGGGIQNNRFHAPALTVSSGGGRLAAGRAVTVCGPGTVAVHAAPAHEPSGAIENAVDDVTLPSGLLNWSKPETVNGWLPPAAIAAEAGFKTIVFKSPALTVSMEDVVLPPFVAVTVCGPATVAVHAAPLQLPSGAMENAVDDATLPSGSLNWSKPETVNGWLPPAAIAAEAGFKTIIFKSPALTVIAAEADLPPFAAVTVCGPATVAVHAAPAQEPSGAIVKMVERVTLPRELSNRSKPSTVNGTLCGNAGRCSAHNNAAQCPGTDIERRGPNDAAETVRANGAASGASQRNIEVKHTAAGTGWDEGLPEPAGEALSVTDPL